MPKSPRLLIFLLIIATGCTDDTDTPLQPEVTPANAPQVAETPAAPTDLGGMQQQQLQEPPSAPAVAAPQETAADAKKPEQPPETTADAPALISKRADEPAGEPAGPETIVEMQVTASALNIRNLPGLNGQVVGRLLRGLKVQALGREGAWVRVGEGQYVSGRYLREMRASDTTSEPIMPTPASK